MYSYIFGFIAIFIVFSNPIGQLLWPGEHDGGASSKLRRTERPRLNESLLAIEDEFDSALACPADQYRTHILSREPLVIYIENFISTEEIASLLDLSEPLFEPSTITHNGASTQSDTSVRLSDVAMLPRAPAVRCIEARARSLQGWRRDLWIERLRTQRYTAGGHYGYHFDWSSGHGGWGRVSSFMAWVAAEGGLEGGGTAFPELPTMSDDRRWCQFIECGEEGDGGGKEEGETRGVIFKAVPGNAVFWENFMADGSGVGYGETVHAGLPVKKGVKVGLNIWSWGRI